MQSIHTSIYLPSGPLRFHIHRKTHAFLFASLWPKMNKHERENPLIFSHLIVLPLIVSHSEYKENIVFNQFVHKLPQCWVLLNTDEKITKNKTLSQTTNSQKILQETGHSYIHLLKKKKRHYSINLGLKYSN